MTNSFSIFSMHFFHPTEEASEGDDGGEACEVDEEVAGHTLQRQCILIKHRFYRLYLYLIERDTVHVRPNSYF